MTLSSREETSINNFSGKDYLDGNIFKEANFTERFTYQKPVWANSPFGSVIH